jgi:outer membrane biosynthesis protein TonB
MMEPRQFIRSDIVASLVAHLSIVALLVLYSEVYPFRAVPSETIAIDLVTPAEVEKKPDPTPSPDLSEAAQQPPPTPAPQLPPQASQPPAPPPPQRQASGTAPKEPARQPAARPQAQPPPPAPTAAPASPGYAPPEPDITVKYHVMLGLPVGPPAPTAAGDKSGGDGVDATASTVANVESRLIAEFRRHLRTCSKLPAEIAPSDKVMIKLRSLMAPDGTLAAEPILIEASASAKGPLLMQGAMSALQACQPYTMLPKDRYGEWKVIDLSFTPRDFTD